MTRNPRNRTVPNVPLKYLNITWKMTRNPLISRSYAVGTSIRGFRVWNGPLCATRTFQAERGNENDRSLNLKNEFIQCQSSFGFSRFGFPGQNPDFLASTPAKYSNWEMHVHPFCRIWISLFAKFLNYLRKLQTTFEGATKKSKIYCEKAQPE